MTEITPIPDTQKDKDGAPPCGIYYRLYKRDNDYRYHTDIVRDLRQIAMVINRNSGYRKNKHIIEIHTDDFADEHTHVYIDTVQADGGVCILRGGSKSVRDSADGVIMTDVDAIKGARSDLGDDAILGLYCGSSRADALKAMERGIDFVAFGIADYGMPDVKLITAWAHETNIPVLALGDITPDTCGLIASSGAEFIDITHYVNTHDNGIMQPVVNILHALSLAETATS